MSGLSLRLVAYKPDGTRLGVLPDVLTMQVSRGLNMTPSLQFAYSKLGRNAEWLFGDVEIAVEWNSSGLWVEDRDSRFVPLSDDLDDADLSGAVQYTFTGVAWMLTRAQVLAAVDADPGVTARPFVNMTPGAILLQCISEARQRGCLPRFSTGFQAAVDAAATPWGDNKVTLSFQPGATIMDVLSALVEAGAIDWCMEGWKLRVFQPRTFLATPRLARGAVASSTIINPTAFLESVRSSASVGEARCPSDETWLVRTDTEAVLTGGLPRYNTRFGYSFLVGQDNTKPGRVLTTWYPKGKSPVDSRARKYGAWLIDSSTKTRYVVVVPSSTSSDLIDVAHRLFDRVPGGAILMASDAGEISWRWYQYADAGATIMLKQVAEHRGVPVLFLAALTAEYKIPKKPGGPHAGAKIHALIQTGVSRKGPFHQAVFDNVRRSFPVSVLDEWDLADLSQKREEVDWASKYGASGVAAAWGTKWCRAAFSSEALGTAPKRASLAVRLAAAIDEHKDPLGIFRGSLKQESELGDISVRGPVELRLGREVEEAPRRSTREKVVSRVYAFGDNFSRTTVENTALKLPWGAQELAVAQGGVEDKVTIERLSRAALMEGQAPRRELSRTIRFEDATWLPYRDYDPGDIIGCQIADGSFIAARVRQEVVSLSTNGFSASVVLEGVHRSFNERVARAVTAATGGTTSASETGGSGVRPVSPSTDKRRPKAPAVVG